MKSRQTGCRGERGAGSCPDGPEVSARRRLVTPSSKGQLKGSGVTNAGWEVHTGLAQAKKAGAGLA